MAESKYIFDLFLSHAGEQKKEIVDCMHVLLEQLPGIRVFTDEHALKAGVRGWDTILEAAETTRVAVVFLTKEFVAKWAPMEELRVFLKRHADPNDKLAIVPILPEDAWEFFDNVQQLYQSNDEAGTWPKGKVPDSATRDEWAARIKELMGITCIRHDQANSYQGQLARKAMTAVVRQLVNLGRLPAGFAWETGVSWHRSKLPPRTTGVVGREDEVARVVAALERDQEAVVRGPAGVGKTTVALEAAWEICARGRCTGGAIPIDFAGFVEDSSSHDAPKDSPKAFLASSFLQQIKACKGMLAPEDPENDSWDSMVDWLQTKTQGNVLLLLENYETVTPSQEVLDMFAQLTSITGRHGRTVLLLLGSRAYAFPFLDNAAVVTLEALSVPQAVELLALNTSGSGVDWGTDQGLARKLAELLERHPLSLTMIAGFIKVKRRTPQEVIDSMSESGRMALAVPARRRQPGTTFYLSSRRVSIEWLEAFLEPQELHMLERVAVFRGSFLAEAAWEVGAGSISMVDQAELAVELQALVAVNVLRREADGLLGKRYGMHLLVRELVVERSVEARLPMLRWMALHDKGPGQLLLRHVAGGPEPNLPIVQELMLGEQLNFKEVVWLLRHLAVAYSHDPVLCALNNVAILALSKQGNLASARLLLEAVLQQCQQLVVEDHHVTADVMTNLGVVNRAQGDLVGARLLQEAALQLLQQKLGDDHPGTLKAMLNLALTLSDLGDLPAARNLEDEALPKMQQQLGDDHPDTLLCQESLARTMGRQGDSAGARKLLEAVVQKRQRLQGKSHPDTLSSMHNLAGILMDQGDLAGARKLEEEVLQARRQLLGDGNTDTLSSMGNLAAIMHLQGEWAGARQLGETVLQERRQLLGGNHPDTLMSMNNLATMMMQEGDPAGARDLLEPLLQKQQQLLGSSHPDTVGNLSNLALVHRELGDTARARQLQETVLEQRRQKLGPNHPATLDSMHNLAATLMEQGELADAQQMQEELLQLQKDQLGDNHPDTRHSKNTLAIIKNEQGDLAGAKKLVEDVLTARLQVLGEDHPETIGIALKLAVITAASQAVVLAGQGDLAGAQQLVEDAQQKCKQLEGHVDPAMFEPLLATLQQQRRQTWWKRITIIGLLAALVVAGAVATRAARRS